MKPAIALLALGCAAPVGAEAELAETGGEQSCDELACYDNCPYGGSCSLWVCVCNPAPEPAVQEFEPPDDWELRWGEAGSCGHDVCVVSFDRYAATLACYSNCLTRQLCTEPWVPYIRPLPRDPPEGGSMFNDLLDIWLRGRFCRSMHDGETAYQCSCLPAPPPEEEPLGEVQYAPGWCPFGSSVCFGRCPAEYRICCCDGHGEGMPVAGQLYDGSIEVRPVAAPPEVVDELPAAGACLPMPWDETEPHEHDQGRHYHCVGGDLAWCERGCCDDRVSDGCS